MNPTFTSSCDSNFTGTVGAFQMSSQYSRIVRSDENLPERAEFRMDICAQRWESW